MRIAPVLLNNNYSILKKSNDKFKSNHSIDFVDKKLNFFEIGSISNVSFGVRPAPPVYLIDKDLNCTLFSKQSDLAKTLGVTPQRLNGCLNGRHPEIDGNVIVYHHQVEKELEDGTSIIDKKKVAEIYNKRTQPRAVYTMDYLGGLKKYDSQSKIPSQKGLFVIAASEVESFDDDGKLILNKKKIAEGVISSPNYFAIYCCDENGTLTKYENQSVFAREKGISKASVGSAISGRIKSLCGLNIIPAISIEIVTDDGEIVVDKQKMIDYLSINAKNEKAVYIVSPNLEFKRYDTRKDLAEQNGMNYSSVLQTSRNVTPTGDYIVPASDIEDYDDNFQLVVNNSKLAKIVSERLSSEALYTIDVDMNLKKYDDIGSVAKALDRKPSTIRTSLWKPELHKSVSDKVVVRASEIEIIDEDGNISIDKKKVSKLVQDRLCKNAVYLVDKNGVCKKFRNRFSAASEYGYNASSSQNVRINGYLLVDASDIEDISEDGSISLNQNKILEYAKKSKSSF